MTAQEKAKELYGKFYEASAAQMFNESRGWYIDEKESASNAKSCAIIAVDEMLSILFQHHEIDYWKQVKEEINKI